MKALTLHAPWAWAIAYAGKRIENRTWKPPASAIGTRIAIHAGANLGSREDDEFCRRLCMTECAPPVFWPTRQILCTARLVGCATEIDSRWFFGPFGWILTDVQLVEPITCSGRLGLWDCSSLMENSRPLTTQR